MPADFVEKEVKRAVEMRGSVLLDEALGSGSTIIGLQIYARKLVLRFWYAEILHALIETPL